MRWASIRNWIVKKLVEFVYDGTVAFKQIAYLPQLVINIDRNVTVLVFELEQCSGL